MLTFHLITEFRRVAALILEDNPAPAQLTTLYALLPERSVSHPDLAQRWNVSHVLAPENWAFDQRHRTPMLRPAGSKMAILSTLFLLAIGHLLSAMASPPIPLLVIPPPTTNIWYFSLQSVPTNCGSSTLIWTNNSPSAMLAWDVPTTECGSTNTLTNFLGYIIAWGADPASLTSSLQLTNPAASNVTLQLIPPPLTNRLVTVLTTGATNLQWSLTPRGPWTSLNATNWTGTNPPSPLYWRAFGRRSSRPAQTQIKCISF